MATNHFSENPVTGKPQLNRMVNRKLILDQVRRDGAISRADIAKITEIRPPTVSAVIRDLIDEGLVEEVGNGQSKGGRAPRMVSLCRNTPRTLGFEVSETSILAGICDLGGEVIAYRRAGFSPMNPKDTVTRLEETGSELLDEAGLTWGSLNGVGLAVPGHMDLSSGAVRWSRPLGWTEVPLRQICESRWGVETDVMNDSAAGSLAAHFLGPGTDCRNLVYLYLRFIDASHGVVGLGSGIIINHELYHGEFGAAGEITTPVVHPLADAMDSQGQPWDGVESLAAAISMGDPGAEAAMDRVARDVSSLVVHAINFLEPGMLVVGSDHEVYRDAMVSRISRTLEEHRLAHEAGKTQIVPFNMGEYGVVRGAVVPTLQRVFRMPRWT